MKADKQELPDHNPIPEDNNWFVKSDAGFEKGKLYVLSSPTIMKVKCVKPKGQR